MTDPGEKFVEEIAGKLPLHGIFQTGNAEALYGDAPRVQTGVRRRCHYRLTDFGQRFVKACIGDGRSSDKPDGGA
jgi:hypothetical protein